MSAQYRRSLRLRSSNLPKDSKEPDKATLTTSNRRVSIVPKPEQKEARSSRKVVKKNIPEDADGNENDDAVEKNCNVKTAPKKVSRSPKKRRVSKIEEKEELEEEDSLEKEEVPAKARRTDLRTIERESELKGAKKTSEKATVIHSNGRPRRGCVGKTTIEKYNDLMSGSASSSDVTSSESENSDLEMEIEKPKKRRVTRGKKKEKEEYIHESSSDSMSEDEEVEEDEEEEEEDHQDSDDEYKKKGRTRGRAANNGRSNRNGGRNGKKNTTQRQKMETKKLPVKILEDRDYNVDYEEMIAWESKSVKMVRDLRELERDRANGGQIMDSVNEFIERCLKNGRMIEMDEKESVRVTHVHEAELTEMNRKKKLTIVQRIKEQVQNEKKRLEEEDDSGDDEEEDEWEEMELVDKEEAKEGKVEVRMDTKKKLNAPWKAKWIRQEVNREVKQRCENIHKAHLLSYISHLRHLMSLAKSSTRKDEGIPLSARILSIIPSRLLNGRESTVDGEKMTNETRMEEITEWWKKTFTKKENKTKKNNGKMDYERLEELIENLHYETRRDAAVFFSSIASLLNFSVRIVARCEIVTKKPKESNSVPNKNKKIEHKADQIESTYDPMSYWCELWNEEKKMWEVFDPFIESSTGRKKKEIKKGKNNKQSDDVDDKDNDMINDFVKSWNTSSHIEEYRSCMEKDGPVLYFIAVDSSFGVRDVSSRYINGNDLISRDLKGRRANEEWLMELWQNKSWTVNADMAREEEKEWIEKLKKMDMPKTVAAFKDHPLYVLDKDVLKMQIIFPYDTEPIGEISKYKIYLRKFVRPINTPKWYEKMGRQIKKDEYPCGEKKVTNPMSGETGTQGLYGYWQTDPWDGGDIIDGRIPRNEFGNVYLYQPEMIPRGCIYLEPEGMQRVASELGKDFVQAVKAWYYKGGNTIPLIRGAVFIKKDLPELLTAWKVCYKRWKEEEKKARTTRCMVRWKKLIKGMLRLAAMRKEFTPFDNNKKKKGTTLDEEAVEEEKASWPQKKYGGDMFE